MMGRTLFSIPNWTDGSGPDPTMQGRTEEALAYLDAIDVQLGHLERKLLPLLPGKLMIPVTPAVKMELTHASGTDLLIVRLAHLAVTLQVVVEELLLDEPLAPSEVAELDIRYPI